MNFREQMFSIISSLRRGSLTPLSTPITQAKDTCMVPRLTFFEIPVRDLARATRFYEIILDTTLTRMDMAPGYPMAGFDGTDGGGWLIQTAGYTPAGVGIVIYFDCNPDLQVVLDRVEAAGGSIEIPKTEIAPHGWRAAIKDTEGNLIGLHSDS